MQCGKEGLDDFGLQLIRIFSPSTTGLTKYQGFQEETSG